MLWVRYSPWMAVLLLFVSCNNNSQSNIVAPSDNNTVDSSFASFLRKFQDTGVPFVYHACDLRAYKDLPQITEEDDSLHTGFFAYARFKLNRNIIAVIELGAADCFLPDLVTYTSDGRIIDHRTIGIGKCGSGPGFSCVETMKIDSAYNLYAVDSIEEMEVDGVDSLNNLMPAGKTYSYIIYRKGKLQLDGKIILSQEMTDTLKVW